MCKQMLSKGLVLLCCIECKQLYAVIIRDLLFRRSLANRGCCNALRCRYVWVFFCLCWWLWCTPLLVVVSPLSTNSSWYSLAFINTTIYSSTLFIGFSLFLIAACVILIILAVFPRKATQLENSHFNGRTNGPYLIVEDQSSFWLNFFFPNYNALSLI